MDSIRQYLLSVAAAAIICGIAIGLSGKKSAYSTIVKMLTGLILAVTVIAPLANMKLMDFSDYIDGLSIEADDAVLEGEIMAREATASIIKSNIEAYILDKAASMDLNIEVEVTLSSTSPPGPSAVLITGAVSPYSKEVLMQYIATDLGIPKENQAWK